MLSRSIRSSLHHSAKRRPVRPAYRCFSCSLRAQNQPSKADHERMTHFGFSDVRQSDKESMGMHLYR